MCSGGREHQDGGSLALTGARCCCYQRGDKNPRPDGLCRFHNVLAGTLSPTGRDDKRRCSAYPESLVK